MQRLNKFLFLLTASCAFAGTWMASPGKGSHGAGGGVSINQWYYGGTGNNDTSFTTDSFGLGGNVSTTAHGGAITVPQSGTLTHLSFDGTASTGTVDFKVSIYDNSNNLVVSGGPLTVSSGAAAWNDIDVTDTAVSAGTYKVMFSGSTTDGRFNYLSGQNGINSTVSYASFPANPLGSPGVLASALPGVRAFVTNKPIAAYRSMAGTTYASRTNTTINKPTGTVDGDIMIMAFVIGLAGTPPTATLPAGWTVIQGPTTQTASGFQVTRRLAWKVASSEGASYTITHSAGSSDGVIITVSNAVNATPVSSSNQGTDTTTTATGITSTIDQSLVLFITHNWALFGTASPPTGTTPVFTERQDSAASLIYVATGVLGTAGATGSKVQFPNGNSSSSDGWGAFLVAVGGGP